MTASSTRHPSSSRRKTPLTFGSRTDIGCIRDHNEDSLVVAPPLFAVADGMGGHAAGEIASEIAVRTLSDHAPKQVNAEALGDAVIAANQEVIAASCDGRGREGMGTTMTAALLENERLVIAQVGDSRAYLLHQGALQQLTRDHSLMADMIEAGQLTEEEARVHPNRSVITRALGSDPHMLADLYEIDVEAGDRLLICSDGLSSMLTDDEIEKTLTRTHDAQQCANTLVNKAIAAGGHDNITVIVVDVTGFSKKKEKKIIRKARVSIIAIILFFLLIIGGAMGGFYYYTQNSVYLAENEGNVALYRGIPGSLFGIEVSQLDYVTDIKVSDLQPGVANRLKEGIRADNRDAAQALINEYKEEIQSKNTGNNTTNNSNKSSSSASFPTTKGEGSTRS